MADGPKHPRSIGGLPTGVDKRAQDLVTENAKLRASLGDLRREHRELLQRLADVEEHRQALESLFVTTYRLHATLDPAEVLATLAEILVNLVGAERYGLWGTAGDGEPAELLLGSDGADGAGTLTSEERALARASLAAGAWFREPSMEPPGGVDAIALVPLKVGADAVGVLVIRKFLDHKAALSKTDRRLLGLLADQAGTALLSARLHAARGRPA